MEVLDFTVKCPQCGFDVGIHQELDPKMLAPTVRSQLRPTDAIFEYKVSSEEIKRFMIDKAREYVPSAKMQIVPRYTERKRRDEKEPHRSYASFFIGFSSDVIKNNQDYGWYGKIGESFENVTVIDKLWHHFIKRYQYKQDMINEWLKSYKKLEKLEEGLGITEQFIAELKQYRKPLGVRTNNGEVWVFFMAAPEMILSDMFTTKKQILDADGVPMLDEHQNPIMVDKSAGRIEIRDIISISKDVIEYKIHLHPEEIVTTVNPHVLQILNGEDKKK